jgi:hypothetical protein
MTTAGLTTQDPFGDAGCRALPYLVSAVADAESEVHYEILIYPLIECLVDPAAPREETQQMRGMRFAYWALGPEPWKERRARFQKWWLENGASYHRWWRVWSPRCRSGSEVRPDGRR